MKLFFMMVMVISLLVSAPYQSKMEKYVSTEGKFTVLFPKSPIQKDITSETKIGQMLNHTFIAEVENEKFAVIYADIILPEEVKNKMKEEKMPSYTEAFVNGLIKNASKKGKVLETSRLNLSNYPGVEIKLEPTPNGLLIYRFFIVNLRVYTVEYYTNLAKEDARAERSKMFLNPLTLLNKTLF